MKKIYFLGVIVASISLNLFGFDKVLYGEDNRRLVTYQSTEVETRLTKSILAQVSIKDPKQMITDLNGQVCFSYQSLESALNYCTDEKFSKLPLFAECTGFLVGPDLLVTAAHCVKEASDCKDKVWVLDYTEKSSLYGNLDQLKIPNDSIFHCLEIKDINYDSKKNIDYALIKLDRKIEDRKFLRIRSKGILPNDANLVVIGHPLGLPAIYTDHILVRSMKDKNSFIINSDTFSGSSGSPVINLNTELVEGILIKGERDLELDIDNNCNRPFKCDNNNCSGETVMRALLLPQKKIPHGFLNLRD